MTSCEASVYTAVPLVKGSGQQGPQKKKRSAAIGSDSRRSGSSIWCNVFLMTLGMFVFGVGVVCWMNCPRLQVSPFSVGNSAADAISSASSISPSYLRASYINNSQSNSSLQKPAHDHGPYHKHELNEPEHDHIHHHQHYHSQHKHADMAVQHNNHDSSKSFAHHHEGHDARDGVGHHHHVLEHHHPRSPSNDHHHHNHEHYEIHHDPTAVAASAEAAEKDETTTGSTVHLDLSDDYTMVHQPAAPLLGKEEIQAAVHVERIQHDP